MGETGVDLPLARELAASALGTPSVDEMAPVLLFDATGRELASIPFALVEEAFDDLDEEDGELFLPTAATTAGARGERFETDLWVHDPAERRSSVSLWRDGRGDARLLLDAPRLPVRHRGRRSLRRRDARLAARRPAPAVRVPGRPASAPPQAANLPPPASVSLAMPRPRPRRLPALVLALLALPAGALGLRAALAPAETPAPGLVLTAAERERVGALARASSTAAADRLADLSGVEVLLVGEEHRYLETQAWLGAFLDLVTDRRVALLLELPSALQPEVDRWVATGGSPGLEEAMRAGNALPYGEVLSWAHRNRSRLSRVAAMDEDGRRIFWNRAFLRDTRNETMARAILDARRDLPGDLVVAYAGQMHVLLAGRYRYDREDRVPAGARLLRAGVPRGAVRSVLLSGEGKAPVCEALSGAGVLDMAGPAGGEPWAVFVDYPVFRAAAARELFDYFVDLGPLTRVALRQAGAR